MKIKYLIHPREYEVAENERFYAEQAEKGWILEKRGSYLSKFRRGEPKKLRYRIEYSAPRFLEEPGLPDEQVDLYEECGWQLAANRGILHVFCTTENSGETELYSTPEQHAEALKGLKRSYRGGIFLLLFMVVLVASILYRNQDEGFKLTVKFVRETPWVLAYGCFLLWASLDAIVGWLRTSVLCRRLKKGLPIDRREKKYHIVFRIVIRAFAFSAVCFLLLMLGQLITLRNWTWEDRIEGPYLTLNEIGVRGEHDDTPFGEESKVERGYSLLAEIWDTREVISKEENGNTVIVYQDVYRMINEGWAKRLAPALLKDATLAKTFREVSVEGLDGAWIAANECVAVKGNLVWYMTMIDFGAAVEDMVPLLEAVAGK